MTNHTAIPLNAPLCLRAHTGNNLQNEFGWRRGRCENQNTQAFEQMMFIKTGDDKVIIQSLWNGRNLQVQPSGLCVFANHNQDLWEKFDVESDVDGRLYFISCHTSNVLQCCADGFARCANTNRQAWEAWDLIFPEEPLFLNSSQLRVLSLTATGAILVPVVGLIAGALVPTAMSTFGTVAYGVGTFHAPLIEWGCAATLQVVSATLVTVEGAAIGAFVGATAGAATS